MGKRQPYSSFTSDHSHLNALMALDGKCSWNPYSQNMWQSCLNQYWVSHVTFNRKPIAFVIGAALDCGNFRLVKVCVHPTFRRRGLSKFLMGHASNRARYYAIDKLDLWLRETQLTDQFAEWNVAPWLLSLGFEAVETKEEMFEFCSYKEAGIRFERKLFVIEDFQCKTAQ